MKGLRNLDCNEIEALLHKYPNAKKIAVETFLSTTKNCEAIYYALECLRKDSLLYGWNQQTIQAIRDGIKLARK